MQDLDFCFPNSPQPGRLACRNHTPRTRMRYDSARRTLQKKPFQNRSKSILRNTTLSVVLFAAAVAVASAQPPAGPMGGSGRGPGGGGRGPALVSPQVNPDRTITVRFRAPNAKEVVVIGEID